MTGVTAPRADVAPPTVRIECPSDDDRAHIARILHRLFHVTSVAQSCDGHGINRATKEDKRITKNNARATTARTLV
jgi:hypothetical protein